MLILLIITSTIAIFIALAVAFREPRYPSNIAFTIGSFATVCTVFGDMMSIYSPEQLSFWKTVVFISEAVMTTAWLLFTVSFMRKDLKKDTGRFSKLLLLLSPLFLLIILVAPHDAFYVSPEFENERVLFLGDVGYLFNLLILLYSIVSIINLEVTLRSSSGINRWQIKYLIIGIGGIIGLNIFYYSHALLYRSLDMNLLPVRIGGLFISNILVGFAILRHKAMDVEVGISRGVFYRSLSIFIIGAYLLGLGLIGEGMRYLNPYLGKNIMALFGFIGAIGILVLMLSEQLRRKVMVFINKNFYTQKYDYRTQWLQFTQLISSKYSFDELIDSIAEGFKDAIGAKWASVWCLNEKENGGFYCAKIIDSNQLTGEPGEGIIKFLHNKKWVFNANDNLDKNTFTIQDNEFISNNKVSLIVPLLDKDNLIGFVVIGEGLAKSDYNYEDYDLLKTLAKQATSAIMNMRLTEELAEARELKAVGKVSSFIMHDLKNAASMLSLIAQNAKEHSNDPDFQRDALVSVANTSEKINYLVQKLKNLPRKMSLRLEYADLGTVVKEVIKELNLNSKTKLNYEEIEQVKTEFDREEIKKVISNLLINAIDATKGKGEISIKVGIQDDKGFVLVSDKGIGMSKEFIETRLFKPFQTTKKKGLGIGLYQCKTIIDAHGGKIKVKSIEGKGTDFFLYLPLVSKPDL